MDGVVTAVWSLNVVVLSIVNMALQIDVAELRMNSKKLEVA